jgi:hypothetical protein
MLNRIDRDAAHGVWTSRWFLPGVLGIAALLEFLLNRLLQPMMTTLSGTGQQESSLLFTLSRFSVNLATVLGIMVTAALVLRATSRGGVASRPVGRVSALLMGTLLCGLSAALVITPDGLSALMDLKRVQWLVQLSAVCLATLTVLGVLTQPSDKVQGLHKLGAVLLLLPLILILETQWGLFTSIPLFQRYGLLTLVYGPVLAVVALGGGALCLCTQPPRPWRFLPATSALLATTTVALLLNRFPNLTTRMIYMSFDLRLPPHAEAYVFYLLSLCTWVFAVVALGVGAKMQQVRGLGLLLIGLSGCQSRVLHQQLFYVVGLFCIAESLLPADLLRGARLSKPLQSHPG